MCISAVNSNSTRNFPRAFNNLFFFYQLNATSIPESDHETPVKDNTESAEQSQYLTTINYDTLSGLREDDQPTEVQSAAKQGSASQEVGEELISTCVTPTRIKTIQRVLSKPETEQHFKLKYCYSLQTCLPFCFETADLQICIPVNHFNSNFFALISTFCTQFHISALHLR